jgi:hypothetical protein
MLLAPKIDKQTQNMFRGKLNTKLAPVKPNPSMDNLFKGKLLVDTPYTFKGTLSTAVEVFSEFHVIGFDDCLVKWNMYELTQLTVEIFLHDLVTNSEGYPPICTDFEFT